MGHRFAGKYSFCILMDILLISFGFFKPSLEKDLFDQYQKRLQSKIKLIELDEPKSQLLKFDSSLENKILPHSFVIGLDEKGDVVSSPELAIVMKETQDQAYKHMVFLIGPADGLSLEIKERCHKLISFGRVTWPHMLMRGLVAEQVYRCQQILKNHPYHRA